MATRRRDDSSVMTDAFWQRVEPLIPVHAREPGKVYAPALAISAATDSTEASSRVAEVRQSVARARQARPRKLRHQPRNSRPSGTGAPRAALVSDSVSSRWK